MDTETVITGAHTYYQNVKHKCLNPGHIDNERKSDNLKKDERVEGVQKGWKTLSGVFRSGISKGVMFVITSRSTTYVATLLVAYLVHLGQMTTMQSYL